jgi:metallo-beta-lactamase class B
MPVTRQRRVSPGLVLRVPVLLLAVLSLAPAAPPQTLTPDTAIECPDCAAWNAPLAPFRVFGNTYFVGTAGLTSLLITTTDGLILVDAGLPQSAPVIDANIRRLGFRTADVKLILTSHAHFDHVGGIQALQRLSGATVAGSASTARALALGRPTDDDPQFAGPSRSGDFPAASGVRVVAHLETLRVGDVTVTVHDTPGHTPGSTSWTWRSCEGTRCLNLAYADSLTAISLGTFRFTGGAGSESKADVFRRSITRVAELPCDILVTPHPAASGLSARLAARTGGSNPDAFIDPGACRAYAGRAMRGLDERVARERATP